MSRTLRLTGAAAIAAFVATGAAAPAGAESVLRIVPHADLKNLDPIWTTAYISRNHGYMIYDTLFALDENLEVRPQMVEDWSVTADGLVWTFRLRDGLAWHDGAPVTAADCVASIERWGARDGMGQKLMDATAALAVVDDRTFSLTLEEPYGLVLQSLGKISSNVPFMMPERLARTDPFEQVAETVGSGPFVFAADEWVPGAKAVYLRNPAYVPRAEAPSFAAGGKRAKVDRVEWLYIPDAATAMNALISGEVDFFELPPHDLLPVMEASPGVTVTTLDTLGNQGWVRLNHRLPPFDNPKAREAVLWAIDQSHYLQAVIGNPDYYAECAAYFGCDTPLETDIGAQALMTQDLERARALVAESGQAGARVVILQATDIPINNGAALITAGLLREIGFEPELQAMDWSTLTSRRAISEPADRGGWNVFVTWWIAADILNPVSNIGVSGGCLERGWFGWPCDPAIEELRDRFARAAGFDEQRRIAGAVQKRALEIVAYANIGRWFNPVAYRESLSGLILSPVLFFWNIEKR